MGTNGTREYGLRQGQIVPMQPAPGETAHDIIFAAVNSRAMETESAKAAYRRWRQARIDKLSAALKVMGWERDYFRDEIKREIGLDINIHTWEAWWKPSRDRFPDEQEFAQMAQFLGLSLDWFSGIRRWHKSVINPNRAFAAAILNQARQRPNDFPADPFEIPEPGQRAA